MSVTIALFLSELLVGVGIGGIFSLVALGLSITFGLLRVANFAHGLFYAVGLYTAAMIVGMSYSFWFAILAAFGICLVLGLVVEFSLIERLYGKDIDFTLAITYGLTLVGVGLIYEIWGGRSWPVTPPLSGQTGLSGVLIPTFYVFVTVATLLIYASMIFFLRRTSYGKLIIAFWNNTDLLQTLGVNPRVPTIIVFSIGTALAGVAGALASPIYIVYPNAAFDMLLIAFAVVVVGGFGSLYGSLLGGIILGEGYALTALFLSSYATVAIFVAMAIIMIFRPRGLLAGESRF